MIITANGQTFKVMFLFFNPNEIDYSLLPSHEVKRVTVAYAFIKGELNPNLTGIPVPTLALPDFQAMSFCSAKDAFVQTEGRKRALVRLLKEMGINRGPERDAIWDQFRGKYRQAEKLPSLKAVRKLRNELAAAEALCEIKEQEIKLYQTQYEAVYTQLAMASDEALAMSDDMQNTLLETQQMQ
jgi:hypothetical protein